jgi:hypothetical protein
VNLGNDRVQVIMTPTSTGGMRSGSSGTGAPLEMPS